MSGLDRVPHYDIAKPQTVLDAWKRANAQLKKERPKCKTKESTPE